MVVWRGLVLRWLDWLLFGVRARGIANAARRRSHLV